MIGLIEVVLLGDIKIKLHHLFFNLVLALLYTSACSPIPDRNTLFTLLPSSHTNITFSNNLVESPQFNIIEYLYFYDGAGVAVGDINNDGLKDLFFTSNQSENKLYLNKGNFVFEDISQLAGIDKFQGWSIGVAMADLNADGFLDIYVSQLGDFKGITGKNLLFINNGGNGLTFTEKAREYGIDHVGFSTQASFFDYDNDGDLDMYLLNHSAHEDKNYGPSSIRFEHDEKAGDKLLKNDFAGVEPRFIDVTQEAGIYSSAIGYGLSVTAADINNDGWIDIFVGNDFHENDYLYLNNGDGTFDEVLEKSMGHTTLSSMGNDVADINNDGLLDIFVLDMLPDQEDILKRSVTEDPEVYQIKLDFGYCHQLSRNTLQLNVGNGMFSEIALLSGIYATDWSWAPLLCDLDNDGFKDLFVANGIFKRPNDLDFMDYKWKMIFANTMNKSEQDIRNFIAKKDSLNLIFLEKMPTDRIANKVYRNNGDLTFTEKVEEWGLDRPLFSNGSAYADLDNDGDLDLVMNNINEKATIFRNNAESLSANNYLQVKLVGNGKNIHGIGTKVILKVKDQIQFQQQMPVRGFQSSVDCILHFGLGKIEVIDTVKIIWPDQYMQILTNVAASQQLEIYQKDALLKCEYVKPKNSIALFKDVTDEININYRHCENDFSDFDWQPLIPHKLSTQGPKLAVADVNGDGLEDFYIGGATNQPGELFIQQTNGNFRNTNQPSFKLDSIYEDIEAEFFDVDGDKDLDLYVVSGGNEWRPTTEHLRDRIYLNDGHGRFEKSKDLLPVNFVANGSCIEPMDFDNDGDIDVFIGSRSMVNNYGYHPKNYILQNDGKGKFSDITSQIAPQLPAGMVTDALWSDINGDQQFDLIIVGEWMPVMVFKNEGGIFSDITINAGLSKSSGWWNCVQEADIDNDGDMDLIAGNLGLNSKLKASETNPVSLYIKDFDRNGNIDQILCLHKNELNVLFATRDELLKQIPGIESSIPSYSAYSKVRSIEDLFTKEQLRNVIVREANTFHSSYIENLGNETFKIHHLPVEAQFSPIFSILPGDFDKDEHMDLLLGGNFNGASINLGLYDASYGLFLRGNGKGEFTAAPSDSGWFIKGEIRDLKRINLYNDKTLILVSRNNDSIQLFDWMYK